MEGIFFLLHFLIFVAWRCFETGTSASCSLFVGCTPAWFILRLLCRASCYLKLRAISFVLVSYLYLVCSFRKECLNFLLCRFSIDFIFSKQVLILMSLVSIHSRLFCQRKEKFRGWFCSWISFQASFSLFLAMNLKKVSWFMDDSLSRIPFSEKFLWHHRVVVFPHFFFLLMIFLFLNCGVSSRLSSRVSSSCVLAPRLNHIINLLNLTRFQFYLGHSPEIWCGTSLCTGNRLLGASLEVMTDVCQSRHCLSWLILSLCLTSG